MAKNKIFHTSKKASVQPLDYNALNTLTDAEYTKAVHALNMRIRRLASSKYVSLSDTFENLAATKSKISKGINPINVTKPVSTAMLTKSGAFSSSLKNMTTAEKTQAKAIVLSMLKSGDTTTPELKARAKKHAEKLGTSLQQYMKDRNFWKAYRDLMEETEYGSDEVFNAVEYVEGSMNYDDLKKKAKEILDDVEQSYVSDFDKEKKSQVVDTMTYDELQAIINGKQHKLTKARVNKRRSRKG